mgnify:CR=1 FL=1
MWFLVQKLTNLYLHAICLLILEFAINVRIAHYDSMGIIITILNRWMAMDGLQIIESFQSLP